MNGHATRTHDSAIRDAAARDLVPLLRRSGLLFFCALALGAGFRTFDSGGFRAFDSGGDQMTRLLWIALSSGIAGALWMGIAREKRRGPV